MKPLMKAYVPPEEDERAIADIMLQYDKNPEQVRQMVHLTGEVTRADVEAAARATVLDERNKSEVWMNDTYQVSVRRLKGEGSEKVEMVHLSIKRRDRKPCHDWRDLQSIKNQLVGPECEGMELYPAESRCVDTANQYHLWVINDPKFRYPWGFNQRAVVGPTPGTKSQQREFNES